MNPALKPSSSRSSWIIAILTFVAGTTITFLGPETGSSEDGVKTADTNTKAPDAKTSDAATAAASAPVAMDAQPVSSCLSDPIVLDEIKKKREEIDQKWKELAAHEAELKARESALDEELKKLQQTRDEISGIESAHQQANQEKIAKVVETLEGMNPKAASTMLSNMDDGLAVVAMTQMSTQKLSKVMNIMEPARASKLTELLAGVVRAKHGATRPVTASNDAAEATIVAEAKAPVAKKGEKPNDQQSEQIISGSEPVAQRAPGGEKP
jgi:flagellar motility protein MotE (MotC chaperone)